MKPEPLFFRMKEFLMHYVISLRFKKTDTLPDLVSTPIGYIDADSKDDAATEIGLIFVPNETDPTSKFQYFLPSLSAEVIFTENLGPVSIEGLESVAGFYAELRRMAQG